MKVRKPYVAGKFYPDSGEALRQQIEALLREEYTDIRSDHGIQKIIGAVVPHAGYMFSGRHAVHFFAMLKRAADAFDTFVIVNPNHTGFGPEIAVEANDAWQTPLGQVAIDREFSDLLDFPASDEAHRYEHSGEVMLPFLQFFLDYPFSIVPVTITRQNPANAVMIAEAVIRANAALKRNICMIASSDFCHYVDPEKGKELDQLVVDEILRFNIDGVYRKVRDKKISMCGYGPVMALMEYALRSADKPVAEVLSRGHSGEVYPSPEVVDYITILFYYS
jgi:MEMO1 family protein